MFGPDAMKRILANLSSGSASRIASWRWWWLARVVRLVRWQREADFRPLFTGVAPEDAAGIVQKLKEAGVEYRLPEAGGSVLVPSAELAELRIDMAAAGLPKTGRIGFELFDKANLGATEFTEHINYRRALEGELERSVMSLAEVETGARSPHVPQGLRIPRSAAAGQGQRPGEAAARAARLAPQNVLAIDHLVASAVEGLSPDAVSVLDMNGNLLGRPKTAGNAGRSGGLRSRRWITATRSKPTWWPRSTPPWSRCWEPTSSVRAPRWNAISPAASRARRSSTRRAP